MIFGTDEPFGVIAAAAAGRWLFRHRSALAPFIVTVAAFIMAAITRHAHHARWWIPVTAMTVTGAILLGVPHSLIRRHPAGRITANILARTWAVCGIDRAPERAYAACVIAVAGGWLAAAIAIGPAVKPLPLVAVIATVVLGVPWWIHRRTRARVRAERSIAAWPQIAEIVSVAAGAWGRTARVILRKRTSADADEIPEIESGLDTRVARQAREIGRGQLATGTDLAGVASATPERPQRPAHGPAHAEMRADGPRGPEAALWAALVAAGPGGVPIADLITATGKGRTWVYERLHRYTAAGKAIQTMRGRWRATSPGDTQPGGHAEPGR
jgi:S-DNA-T family DNA segregation ATPase FtsK/SpoIIIE